MSEDVFRQVHAVGADTDRQARVARNKEANAATAAEVREFPRQGLAVRAFIVTQDDGGAARKGRDRRQRIGQPGRIGHQDQRRQGRGLFSLARIEPLPALC